MSESGSTTSAADSLPEEGPPLRSPVVSVCMITYNHAPFIAQALDSVLMQETDFPYEILIHDDCSTDGTTEIVRSYAARHPERIRPVYQKENQYSKGRKATPQLFKMARGKYIALLEGDDAWTDPHKLSCQAALLEARPDFVMCYGNVAIVDAEGRSLGENKIPPEYCRDLEPEEIIRYRCVIPTSTLMFRPPTDLHDWFGNVNRVLNGDSFLFAMLARYGGAGFLDFSPSLYRQHPGGIYSTMDLDRRHVESIRTMKVIRGCIGRAYRPWITETIAEAYAGRSEHLRRAGRYAGLLWNILSLLCFAVLRRGAGGFRRDAWEALRQLRKVLTRRGGAAAP